MPGLWTPGEEQECGRLLISCAVLFCRCRLLRCRGFCAFEQHGFVLSEKIFDIRLGADGIGNADSIVLAEFVMNEQVADKIHSQAGIRHVPDLTIREGFQADFGLRFGLH